MVGTVTRILSLADAHDRRIAAAATAAGAALFYGFGNFVALAALPSAESVRRVNRLKGRLPGQPGSVTSDPSRMHLPFDWASLPPGLTAEMVSGIMTELNALGPIGFRGPAAAWVPDHLTARDGLARTVQHISPGVRCRSNRLVADVLDRAREDILFVTSANRSSAETGREEPAHYEMAAVEREFGRRPGVVLIGHVDEERARASHPRHLPCSTSIVAFHQRTERPAVVLERLGSLDAEHVRVVAARHGAELLVAPAARTRVPVREPALEGLRAA